MPQQTLGKLPKLPKQRDAQLLGQHRHALTAIGQQIRKHAWPRPCPAKAAATQVQLNNRGTITFTPRALWCSLGAHIEATHSERILPGKLTGQEHELMVEHLMLRHFSLYEAPHGPPSRLAFTQVGDKLFGLTQVEHQPGLIGCRIIDGQQGNRHLHVVTHFFTKAMAALEPGWLGNNP
ncbi:hypothetical protein D3C80_895380 [compost metagenome]